MGSASQASIGDANHGSIDDFLRSGFGGNLEEANPKKLPLPQFTTYGSPVAPSYASYTFNGPPSPTALASLGQRQEEYDEYEDEDYEEQELEKVGEEGSLLSCWQCPPWSFLDSSSSPPPFLAQECSLDLLWTLWPWLKPRGTSQSWTVCWARLSRVRGNRW